MRIAASLALLATLGVFPLASRANTIFVDGFNTATNPGLTVTTTVGNFNVLAPTNVDLLGPGTNQNYGYLCAPGVSQCVDLNGSGGTSSGSLESNMFFAPGQYLLSFNLIGSGRGPTTSTLVSFGDYYQTFTLASGDNTTGVISNQLVMVTGEGSYFTFEDMNGNTNIGSVLNSASVATTPEPSSIVLLGSGLLAGVRMLSSRRKRSNA